jgi:hypothetical protein
MAVRGQRLRAHICAHPEAADGASRVIHSRCVERCANPPPAYQAHRSRLRFMPDDPYSTLGTPTTGSFPPSGTATPPEGLLHAAPPRIFVTEEQFR